MFILNRTNHKTVLRVLIPVLIFIAIFPTPEGLSPIGQKAFALVAAGIVTFILQPISISISVPLFVMLGAPIGIFNVRDAMSSFMGPAFIFVFAMVCIALAFEKSGLTKRIALFVVSKSGGSPRRLILLFIATAAICSSVMADIPVLCMLYPICQQIIETNGCNRKGSNFAQSLLLGIGCACFLGGMGTPAGSAANPTSMQILQDSTGMSISFMDWACVGMPIVLCLIPVIWICLIFALPSEISKLEGIEELKRERENLGPLTVKEKSFLIIFLFTLLLWFTDKINGIPVAVSSMICVAVLALPGIDVFSWKRDSAEMNWDAVMLVGGATSFGAMLTTTGVINWFAHEYLLSLVNLPIFPLLACICIIMILSQFPIPAGAGAVATMAPAFLAVAQMKGIDPAGILLVVALSQAAPILSPAVCFYPIINASGLLTVTGTWKAGFPMAIGETVLILLSMATFGRLLGFI